MNARETALVRPASGAYQVFMLGLSLYVLAALAAQALLKLDEQTLRALVAIDTGVCLIFLADFVGNLFRATSKWRYLVTWGWLDLLSSIPTVDLLRWGRTARIFRIIRVLRGLRATRHLSQLAFQRRAQSAFWTTALIGVLSFIFGSIAILHLEVTPESNIRTAEDALWWSFVTVTTVGYGDHYPVTASGRVLAAAMMIVGIGLFGTFTAFVASSFLAPGEAEQDKELEGIREELASLRQTLPGASDWRD